MGPKYQQREAQRHGGAGPIGGKGQPGQGPEPSGEKAKQSRLPQKDPQVAALLEYLAGRAVRVQQGGENQGRVPLEGQQAEKEEGASGGYDAPANPDGQALGMWP